MDVETKISEFIGNVADLVVGIHGGDIQQSDLVSVIHIAGVENQKGDDYKRSDGLIRKAYQYHASRQYSNTACNIQSVFKRSDGTPIIR